jgi:hypothetical protein
MALARRSGGTWRRRRAARRAEELLREVLEAAEPYAPQRRLGWVQGPCDGAAGVQWVEVPPRRADDAEMLGQDAADEGRACWCGAAMARWTSSVTA